MSNLCIKLKSSRAEMAGNQTVVIWNRKRLCQEAGTRVSAISWAQDHGLLPRTKICPTHRVEMTLTIHDVAEHGLGRFRCHRDHYHYSESLAKNTWFEGSNLSIEKGLRYIIQTCLTLNTIN